nr:MAG TPA: hypothetical protein [Caudoviricetes sp.]
MLFLHTDIQDMDLSLIILLSFLIAFCVAKTFWQFLFALILCLLNLFIGGIFSFIILKLWNSDYI